MRSSGEAKSVIFDTNKNKANILAGLMIATFYEKISIKEL